MALMSHIESYNASYPLSYYKIGTVYSFYGTSNTANTTHATDEQIRRYSDKLIALEQEEAQNAIQPVAGSRTSAYIRNGMSRYYAVVVEKTTGIIVMFINRDSGKTEYFLKKYAVSHPVDLDGKDLMPVSTHTSYGSDKTDGKSNSKPGQLTRATRDEKVGQLTHRHSNENPSAGSNSVGQLTHTPNAPEPRIGQLTWAKRGR